WIWLGFFVVPSRSTAFSVALAICAGSYALGGLGLLWDARVGRLIAAASSVLLLAFTAALLALLTISAAYLKGVYGSLGLGLGLVAWLIGALVVELFAIVPWLQLRKLAGTWRAPR